MCNQCERVWCDGGGLLASICMCEKLVWRFITTLFSSPLILTWRSQLGFSTVQTATRCRVGDLWYFTSVIQKLFFRILTHGDVGENAVTKGLKGVWCSWAALWGFDILVALTISKNAFQQPPRSLGMCLVKCSIWCHMNADVFEVAPSVHQLLCGSFLKVTALSF